MILLFEKKNNILDSFVIAGVIIFFSINILFSSGQIRPDSIQYFLQAQDFWNYKVNFPLGYSFYIKIFSLITSNYFIASKLINILSYLTVIFFSYKKKFFFPQTILIFSFYPFVNFYFLSLSEPLFYLFNYLIIYVIYKIIEKGFSTKYTFSLGALFFFLISVRFSGLFIFFTAILFLGFITYKKKYSLKSFFTVFTISSIGVFSYLIINYCYCGFILGQRKHLKLINASGSGIEFTSKLALSTFKHFSFLNIFISKGIISRISFLNVWISASILIISFVIVWKKRKKLNYFNYYLLFSLLGITASLVYSFYTTKIDDNIRIKSNVYLYLLFFLSLNISKNAVNYCKIFLIIALYINIFTVVEYSKSIFYHIKKYEVLISNSHDKTIEILYEDLNDNTIKSHAQILFFKTILIDKGYKIYEGEKKPNPKVSKYHIKASDIIE
ncbi:hypothetical protein SAMN05421664_1296 [Chryseobacterium soldanellicola]|uniref:Dolichyl-phosphate-mannose-protein mannosyltransferase n=1 Tax=Chryseobacterium soldanellicola TaxID=311333 RepID=A0A1H1A7I9_9FLAO|nr:hypothetical protein [Chryseobacterium soldanellicola]SDQ35678.1 hypothetical protein SAMN05421664_1296 [Chryseobacterium soldanellicola]